MKPLALCLSLGLLSSGASAAQQTLIRQFDFAGGGLSANGKYVASYALGNSVKLWSLGTGLVDFGGDTSLGLGVSNDGTVALAQFSPNGGQVIVQGQASVAIPGAGAVQPIGLSSDGQIVLGKDANGAFRFEWSSGAVVALNAAAGTDFPNPKDLSGDGSLMVGSVVEASNNQLTAVTWDASGQVTRLDPSGAFSPSDAWGVSDNGEWVVGVRRIAPGTDEGFLWSSTGGFVSLPSPGASGPSISPIARFVSNDGQVVIGRRFNLGFPFEIEGYAWTPGGGALYLRDYVVSQGGPYLTMFTDAEGLSTDGTRILMRSSNTALWIDLDAEVGSSYCGPAVPNSTGQPGRLVALGSASVSDGALLLRAQDLPPAESVLPLASLTQGFAPMAGGSLGNLCLGGAIGRFPVATTDGAGQYEFPVDLGAIPIPSGSQAAMVGQTWSFQAWYRDSGSSNFTDGAAVLLQ